MKEPKLPFKANEGKTLVIDTKFGEFYRYPVKTHIVTESDTLSDVLENYLHGYLEPDDCVFVSEKIVAITQGRAFPVDSIKPRRLARVLSRFVKKTPHGIGLGMPCTMELAIRELGTLRIIFAALCSAVTKLFGVSGVFYRILGEKARAIDGPCECTIAPYNRYAKLAPDRPNDVAKELSERIGAKVVVIDANDLGVEVLGRSDTAGLSLDFCRQVFRDNPLAQCSQQTPLCIVRKTPACSASKEKYLYRLSKNSTTAPKTAFWPKTS